MKQPNNTTGIAMPRSKDLIGNFQQRSENLAQILNAEGCYRFWILRDSFQRCHCQLASRLADLSSVKRVARNMGP